MGTDQNQAGGRGDSVRAKGAYLLVIELAAPLRLDSRAFAGRTLPPGRYAYCGSAYGPGGLSARLGRHLRGVKPRRWHVDELTNAGRVTAAAALPGGSECRLAALLSGQPGVEAPLPGFGSSDCRRCRSHLLRLPASFDPAALALPWLELENPRGPGVSSDSR